jgi:hypothetical protein
VSENGIDELRAALALHRRWLVENLAGLARCEGKRGFDLRHYRPISAGQAETESNRALALRDAYLPPLRRVA